MPMTVKEWLYIGDSLNNEDMLTRLCVHGAVECRNQQLRQTLSRMAETRLGIYQRLLEGAK